ncbi:MAG: hypothetical protein GDA46_05430 [Bdellovibrionales bacterium]|nr:hypothetical protein [Bdellovibrionales bacterium]
MLIVSAGIVKMFSNSRLTQMEQRVTDLVKGISSIMDTKKYFKKERFT